ncbi:flagellar basal-body P-ring formation protein [Candidatus Photodesmus katoptron]|uniref:Flagella basal body P-ring formation protein FlgA n=1 Tax=Candidatus Photodesmus katoptron Akat1 TaxID=1236703 RepID=S3E1B0_9GAMM|nr:flagellar basal body P-ring formation chaperone FlgA [Candidatus Photodesmus katoptron]EPE37971.1 flagella basal body P-ring formation protein FlgA [Candidatus Photodesmus katoptron Akat1]KEY90243.1 flagellar basal-body P-ring formation protein [Candidatus Photodesmus katoptron]
MIYLKSCWRFSSITKCRALYIFFYCSFSFCLYSSTEDQIKIIQKTAEDYIISHINIPESKERIKVKASNIRWRSFITNCSSPLIPSSPSLNFSTRNITVLIQCKEDNWKIYVPVQITRFIPQIIMTSSLNTGQIIKPDHITIRMTDLYYFHRQGVSSLEEVIGAKVKRNLYIGDFLEINDVCIVCRNDIVTIKAIMKGITITDKGIALKDGHNGEKIKVKNKKSKQIIEGIITGSGEVTVQI